MYLYCTLVIIQTLLAGVFGWFIGELAGKCNSGEIKKFKEWKAWVLELIFIGVIFIAAWMGEYRVNNKIYNTKEYEIETIDTTFDSDSTEVTTYKIVKK